MIKLRYKRGGFVYLIERHFQLEIFFSCFGKFPEDCTRIRDLILESIYIWVWLKKKLHIIQEKGAMTKVDSYAPVARAVPHHTCAYNPLSGILECMEPEETGESCKLDPQHLLWLGTCSTLHSLLCLLVIITFCTLPLLFGLYSKPGATIHQLSVTETTL